MNLSILISIIAFTVASNLDNLGICIAYGVSGTKIGPMANLIIAAISMAATAISIVAGGIFGKLVGNTASQFIGVGSMLLIGGWLFLKSFADNLVLPGQRELREVYKLYIKPLGLVVSILKEPLNADLDRSQTIDLREATFIGVALAINCLASGIALGLISLPVISTSIAVGLGSYISTELGCRIGGLAHRRWNNNHMGMLAGVVMILLALFQFFS